MYVTFKATHLLFSTHRVFAIHFVGFYCSVNDILRNLFYLLRCEHKHSAN